ncbi:DUF4338 domain-containing protein [Salinibacter ruber]|uniref:DUF4338 domain-containing protein n=1 Tax=Salinibacter ruber TaxID=146919 RepID=UPI002168E5A8|nr:DUF4338 domain-containing protein [Salinibacter ruber]MCS3757486.1 hypothetical protein [Salinibacter ruber]
MSASQSDTYTLRPEIPESASFLYNRFLERVDQCQRQDKCQKNLARLLLNDDQLFSLPESDHLSTRLFFEVFEDLTRHGWQFDVQDDSALIAIPPDATTGSGRDRQEVKARIRKMLVEARNEQLREPNVRRFINKMERPRWHRGRQVSVQDLFADPQDFSSDLQRRLDSENPEELIYEMVDPYLQRATDEHDDFTGLRLRDVWRYCRYTWSLPQKTQPGRRMNYLIRDAARPLHPVMGIGALGSSVMQITCREEEIGWTLDALEHAEFPGERMVALVQEVGRSIDEIYRADFDEEEILSDEEVVQPTDESLQRLAKVAENRPDSSARIDEDIPLEDAARRPLYRYKRAKTLYKLLRARLEFQRADDSTATEKAQLSYLLDTEEGRRALNTALRSQKKRHVGSSMMNITTCGAIPPYNPVLGGKLAGLLMVSPQVISDYQEKYGGTTSYIASRMKGAPLERRNQLVLLETTSLYSVGSSQYNRLRAPVANGEVRYNEIGLTDGYGSVHLSERTYRSVQELLSKHSELEEESNEFGHGGNYKIRSISSALDHLGISVLQRHKNPRLVYAIPLAENWKAYLTGRDSESELLYEGVEEPGPETQDLANFWKHRWFIKRVQKPMIQRRLKKQRGKVRVSELVPEKPCIQTENSDGPDAEPSTSTTSENGMSYMPSDDLLSWKTLARLVRGRASFAERLSDEELSALHIHTKLDDGLIQAVRDGKRVYLTGNPGDGKTHIIERHREVLQEEDAFHNLDASATDERDLADDVEDAIEDGRPAVIAVNEGPLRQLKKHLPEQERIDLNRQLDRPFLYEKEKETEEKNALLVNLGLRQILAPDTLDGALNLILNRVDYTGAPEQVRKNHDLLKRPRVQDRLKVLLTRVAQSGRHVRMRNLLSFLSFIITGGVTSAESEVEPYYQLAFSEKHALHDVVSPLDPAGLSHPLVDAKLWDGVHEGIEWFQTLSETSPVECTDSSSAQNAFSRLKRRFYFEAENGDALFDMLPKARQDFYRLLDDADEKRDTVKQDILQSLARFFGDSPEDSSEIAELPIWTGLRYRADGPPSALIASSEIERDDVVLKVPRLRPEADEMIKYRPSHIRLLLRNQEGGSHVGLNIDLSLWLELMKVDRGMPPRLRDPLIERRIERFLARVSASQQSEEQGLVRLTVRDVNTGDTYPAKVSLEQKKYRL